MSAAQSNPVKAPPPFEPLPPDVIVREEPSGVRYILPVRNFGKLRWVGVVALAIGFVVFALMAPKALGIINAPPTSPQGSLSMVADLLGLIFGIVMLAFAIGALLLGIFVNLLCWFSRCSVRVGGDQLRLTEHAGMFRWTWGAPAHELESLEVATDAVRINDQPVTSGPLSDMGMIKATFAGERIFAIAMCYPTRHAVALAHSIAERTNVDVRALDEDALTIDITHPDEPERELLEQPPRSDAEITRNEDGVSIYIPPGNPFTRSKGLFGFGILWTGFMVFFTSVFIFGAGSSHQKSGPFFIWGMIILFFMIGFSMLFAGFNMARRRVYLDVVGDTLMINRKSLFGIRTHTWTRDQIEDVRLGPSGMSSNDEPIMQLHIRLKAAKRDKFGLLTQRPDDEIRWIASELRQALHLGE